MSTFAFVLKRFVWKTKVCHPSVENQPLSIDHAALHFGLGPPPTLGNLRLSDPLTRPNCRRWVRVDNDIVQHSAAPNLS